MLFLLFSGELLAEASLYDELNFLQEASKEVEVFLPGEKKIKKKPLVTDSYTDIISTGQAGILKKPLKTEGYDEPFQPPAPKKRLRFRSR